MLEALGEIYFKVVSEAVKDGVIKKGDIDGKPLPWKLVSELLIKNGWAVKIGDKEIRLTVDLDAKKDAVT